MKIAFINPNMHDQYPRPPLGLLSVATACKVAGYDVRIIDANLENLSPQRVMAKAIDCEVVAITATTPAIIEAIAIADALWDKTIILGGIHASVFTDECADLGMFDVVITGEGEAPMLEALRDIESGKTPDKKYLNMNSNDLDNLPLPDYSLLDLNKYKARYPHMIKTPWTTASTSRGCIYDCSFCCKAISGNVFRCMSADRMLELINRLQSQHDIQDITFYDDIFTLNRIRIKQFCDGLIHSGSNLTWTCESRVNLAEPSILQLMHDAGCRLIYYGIESGSQRILDSINKGISLGQIKQAARTTQDCGIQAAGYFMLGCPGETKETIQETVDFAKELHLDHAQFTVCSPLPGSDLWLQYLKTGLPVPGWDKFRYLGGQDKPMFISPELSREDIENAVSEANEYYTEKVA